MLVHALKRLGLDALLTPLCRFEVITGRRAKGSDAVAQFAVKDFCLEHEATLLQRSMLRCGVALRLMFCRHRATGSQGRAIFSAGHR